MFVKRFAFGALLCLFLGPAGFAQQNNIALGRWRTHFPYYQAQTITKAGNRLYCGTIGGFFYYDLEDNSLHTLSKTEGFSDVGVQLVSYDETTGITLVAYTNTNLDLIQPNGTIVNLTDIFRKSILGVKQIRSVYFHNKLAYLSTSFGVVVVDLQKNEIKDTYSNLGPNGAVLDVRATTILNDSIYVAASYNNTNLVKAARISVTNPDNSVTYFNLLDYTFWYDRNAGLPTNATIATLTTFQNKIYAGVNQNAMYYFNGQTWQPTSYSAAGSNFFSAKVSGSTLTAATTYKIIEFRSPTDIQYTDNDLIEIPRDAERISENELWVADALNGLLKVSHSGTEAIVPNGPFDVRVSDISAVNGRVAVAGGSYDQTYTGAASKSGIYLFDKGEWTNFNPIQIKDPAKYPDVRDVVEIVQDPNSGTIYFSPYGYGVVEWKGEGNFTVHNETNSPLVNVIPNGPYTRVAGLALDNSGALWVTNRNEKTFGIAPSLFEYKNGTWKSYSVNFAQSGLFEKLAIDDYNQKWIIMSKNASTGVLVYNTSNNQYIHLTTNSSSKLPGTQANCITRDLNGAIWIGTINGVARYLSPGQIMAPNTNVESRPQIEGRYLLENQNVLDIAVDGGNRKWVASDNGLWLFNEGGTEQIAHFTTENSPLPSNRVTKVAVDNKTGEVFAATEAGMVSYRSPATLTETDNSCKGVFPNPVRPGFTGMVGISGVPKNALIKITDLAGVLVHEVQANGNMAAWDLKDYNGRKVQAGVYLVLGASADGSEQYMCKVAVLD